MELQLLWDILHIKIMLLSCMRSVYVCVSAWVCVCVRCLSYPPHGDKSGINRSIIYTLFVFCMKSRPCGYICEICHHMWKLEHKAKIPIVGYEHTVEKKVFTGMLKHLSHTKGKVKYMCLWKHFIKSEIIYSCFQNMIYEVMKSLTVENVNHFPFALHTK